MTHRVRFTRTAKEDLLRLYAFQVERDLAVAEKARDAIAKGIELLSEFPFACRKAAEDNPFLREMIISLGSAGYVMLFEIEDERTVTILAVRHQLEDDYH